MKTEETYISRSLTNILDSFLAKVNQAFTLT